MRIGKPPAVKADGKGLSVEAHVPFRLQVLLKEREWRDLSEVLIERASEAAAEVERFTEICRSQARIAHGRYFSGTWEYRDRSGEDQNIDADVFCRAEFPGVMQAWGNIGPEGCDPSEFLLTTDFTLALWKPKKKSPSYLPFLLLRVGTVEYHIVLKTRVPSLAEALVEADGDPWAKQIVGPIALRVAECHMLDG